MGASSTLMGLSVAFETIAECLVMIYSSSLLLNLGASYLLFLSFLALLFRCAGYFLVRIVDIPLFVLPFDLLYGFTMGASWVAMVHFAETEAPDGPISYNP